MTRRTRLTSRQAAAHNRRVKADPYLMHQDREVRPVEKYMNGDPSAWAEDPMPAPPYPTPRTRINLPEFTDTAFDHKNEDGWGDADGKDYDNGYTRRPSDDQDKRMAFIRARKRARIALILASRMVGKTASSSTLQKQAWTLMQLPARDLVAMFRAVKAEEECAEDEEVEAEDEEVEKEARLRRARLQRELNRIASEEADEAEAEDEEDVEAEDEEEEAEKEARRRLARLRARRASEDEEEAEEDETEARARKARMAKLNRELTRLASMDSDEEEAEDEECAEDAEEVEKEARRHAAKARQLAAKAKALRASEEEAEEEVEAEDEAEEAHKEARALKARVRKLRAKVRNLKASSDEEEADEECAEEAEEAEKEARRLKVRARKLKAEAEGEDAEVEAEEAAEDAEDVEKEARALKAKALKAKARKAGRRAQTNKGRRASDMMDDEAEADESDMSMEDMQADLDAIMSGEAEDEAMGMEDGEEHSADMDALEALMAEDHDDSDIMADDLDMTPEVDLMALEAPVVASNRTASSKPAKRGVRSVGSRTASGLPAAPAASGDVALLTKMWGSAPNLDGVLSSSKS